MKKEKKGGCIEFKCCIDMLCHISILPSARVHPQPKGKKVVIVYNKTTVYPRLSLSIVEQETEFAAIPVFYLPS